MGLLKELTGHSLSEMVFEAINPPYSGDGHTTEMYERMDENGRKYSSESSD
jgi:hypothetical protein